MWPESNNETDSSYNMEALPPAPSNTVIESPNNRAVDAYPSVEESRKKSIFKNLVELQDSGMGKDKSEMAIKKKYGITDSELLEIIMDGHNKNWLEDYDSRASGKSSKVYTKPAESDENAGYNDETVDNLREQGISPQEARRLEELCGSACN